MKQLIHVILYQPLYNALIFLVWLMPGNSVGLAIILLTIVIRLILLPSGNKALKAQKEMRDLQPKMDKIRKEYKKEEQAQAIMKMYKDHKVSPYGSCLPLLIQLPIIFALYRVFTIGLDKSRFDMLYHFMPQPQMINTHFFGIDLAQPERWVLPIITGVLQYLQVWQIQKYTQPATTGKGDMQSMLGKQMMYLTPVMTILIAMRLPAALPLYWLASTLFAVVQQWLYFRNYKSAPALAEVGGADNKGDSDKEVEKVAKEKPKLLDRVKSLRSLKKKDVVVTVRRKGE